MQRGIDHIVHAVHSLDECKALYEQQGFTSTPNALHPWGTGNSLIQFERNFIEILDIARPELITAATSGEFSFGDHNRRFLQGTQGMSMLVFSSTDAEADRARWQAAGLQTYPLFDFSRSAILPGGEQVTVAFTLAFVVDPHLPDVAFFVCQQHFPEHFWKAQYQQHANAAQRMDCVWMQAAQPQQCREFFAKLFDDGEIIAQSGGFDLQLPYGRVAVRTAGALSEQFPGMNFPALEAGARFAAVTVISEQIAEPIEIHGLLVERRAENS